MQSGDHLLNTYDEQISSFTEQNFKKEDNNVTIVTGTRYEAIFGDSNTHYAYYTVNFT